MLIQKHKNLLDKLSDIDELNVEMHRLLNDVTRTLEEIKTVQKEINKVIEEKSKGFPWLADRIAEYFQFRDFKLGDYFEKKFMTALSTAERVKEIAKEKRVLKKEFLIARNFVQYYENLFPWITEYVGDNLDDLIKEVQEEEANNDNDEDPVLKYITKGEYSKRSDSERNQIALDRYYASRKYSWQIGRDYERYVGYLYEVKGWDVFYQGIELGMEDLGRDLICKKKGVIEIIQCKYWAHHKTIHEKHINQLYGTAVKYYLDLTTTEKSKSQLELFPDLIKKGIIKASFITSTKLSETARKFAEALGITIKENFPLDKYPVIKCNLSSTGNKIYHLPFDQQYDKTQIRTKGEYYVSTVAEAEKLGFRRAWKWHSESQK